MLHSRRRRDETSIIMMILRDDCHVIMRAQHQLFPLLRTCARSPLWRGSCAPPRARRGSCRRHHDTPSWHGKNAHRRLTR